LSQLLAVLGGLTSLVHIIISALVRPYQEFSLKSNLISSFYSVDKSNKGSQINIEDDRKLPALAEMLSNRKKYTYSFCSYWCIKLRVCSCLNPKYFTLKRFKAQKLYDESVMRLGRELDIMALVSEQRLSAFAHKLLMSRHQRWLVNKSQRFNLACDDQEKMVKIQKAEEKEARTIKPGYSWKTYSSIETRTDKLDLFE